LGGEVDSVGVDRAFVDQATLSDRGDSRSSESLYDRRLRAGTTSDVRYSARSCRKSASRELCTALRTCVTTLTISCARRRHASSRSYGIACHGNEVEATSRTYSTEATGAFLDHLLDILRTSVEDHVVG